MEEKDRILFIVKEIAPPRDKEKGQKKDNQERLFRHSRKDAAGEKILILTNLDKT